jgi:hypothetical protein
MLSLTKLRISISYIYDPDAFVIRRRDSSPVLMADKASVWKDIDADLLPESWEAFDLVFSPRSIPMRTLIAPIKFRVISAITSLEIGLNLVFDENSAQP